MPQSPTQSIDLSQLPHWRPAGVTAGPETARRWTHGLSRLGWLLLGYGLGFFWRGVSL